MNISTVLATPTILRQKNKLLWPVTLVALEEFESAQILIEIDSILMLVQASRSREMDYGVL